MTIKFSHRVTDIIEPFRASTIRSAIPTTGIFFENSTIVFTPNQ